MTQAQALEILKMGQNVFLTGSAGSGKTFLLKEYIAYLRNQGIVPAITASTGIAATHMNGMTIHSWSGIGIRDKLSSRDLDFLAMRSGLEKRIKETKVLIIDEISMLHHFRLDMVDKACRYFKENNLPFGGMQVILCGDFFQLPPVSREDEAKALFAYHAPSWQDLNLKICYLEEQHRQKDLDYLNILNAIRENRFSEKELSLLRSRYKKTAELKIPPTKLYSHNIDVEAENERELAKLPEKAFQYEMSGWGKKKLLESLAKNCLAPEILKLKKGAKVMLVKNNPEKGYVNGTVGIIHDLGQSKILVRIGNGRIIDVATAAWTVEENGDVKAEIKQYPLRLAWAITVHKSQGMSLDAAEIDLSGCFEKGMGYVALSRVRSLEGLSLLGLNDVARQVNEEVLETDQGFRDSSQNIVQWLKSLKTQEILNEQKKFLVSIGATGKRIEKKKNKEKIDTVAETERLFLTGKSLGKIAEARGLKKSTILEHLEKLKQKNPKADLSSFVKDISPIKLKKIKEAFEKSDQGDGKRPLSPVKEILGDGYSYDEIKLVRLVL